ncbi:lipid-A-disaccharide synthase [Aestuariibacter salexigens]|uniref:lipid-A-disaccharide synthase n=1 Tax=Aestuariibacter salexigens TaxID=226010 RepID=UPI0003F55F99|nr:lipid-A-disaccharide synthase [Aestuariibacter salexigens]
MPSKSLKIGIVAGEASGDILAAGVVASLKKRFPNAQFIGVAGPNMQAQGVQSLFDMEQLSVMGLVEVLAKLRHLLALRKQVIHYFLNDPPDVYIGVDAPDFNLTVEKHLKQAGIPTVHYVSPTVWAWREKRIHKIAAATDLVLGLFPFEHEVYERYGLGYRFVGHTMADLIPMCPDREAAREALDIAPDVPLIALLPGSRGAEVNNLLQIFVDTAQRLSDNIDNLNVIIPAVNPRRREQIEQILAQCSTSLPIHITDLPARQAMIAANAVLLASGTATLEAMLCKRPMVVAYKMNALTHMMMKRLYKPDYFALPNILANKPLVPEFLQQDVNPQNLADHLLPMLMSADEALIDAFNEQHRRLQQNADEQAAEAVAELIAARQGAC